MSIAPVDSDKLSYALIKQGLRASDARAKAISHNMANVNTKGFKRVYVEFEDGLKDAEYNMNLKLSNCKHLKADNDLSGIRVKRDESNSMRTDGNNVDLDIEKTQQASNQLMYNALITLANSKINSTKYIITGGGR